MGDRRLSKFQLCFFFRLDSDGPHWKRLFQVRSTLEIFSKNKGIYRMWNHLEKVTENVRVAEPVLDKFIFNFIFSTLVVAVAVFVCGYVKD